MDNLATVLSRFAESLDETEVSTVAELSPVAGARRLGYLLYLVGMQE